MVVFWLLGSYIFVCVFHSSFCLLLLPRGDALDNGGGKNDILSRDSNRRGGVAQKGVASAQLFRFHSFDLRFSALKK